MSSPVEVSYLDGLITVNETEPSTITELIELLGEQAVRQGAIDDNRYRNKNPRVGKKVSLEVEADGFARGIKKTETKADGTLKEIKISVNDHIREYWATGEDAQKALAEKFDRIANSEPLYVKGERAGGGGKISKDALDNANKYFAAGDEAVSACASAIEANVPGYKVGLDADGAATPDSLARGIQALGKHLQQQAQKQALGSLPKL